MKTTPNLTFQLKDSDGKPMTAAKFIALCLANPPPQGFDFATMRGRNRVADAIEKVKAGGEIKLEDADHAVAVEAVRQMKWGTSHKDILKFGELFGL